MYLQLNTPSTELFRTNLWRNAMVKNRKKGSYEIDMCSGSILGKMLLFALPLMFSSILQLLFNAADVIVVGKFAGDNSLAAVGSTGSLVNLLTTLFMGLSVGANVLVSRYYGAKQERDVHRTVHTAMLTSVLSGVLLAVVGVFAARQLLEWMDSPEDVIGLASLYLRIYFLGMPAMMVYNFGSAILRAIGDTKRPLYYLSLAGVINVVLNMVFVIVFHMDVAGVALATIISQYISATLVVRCMIKETGAVHLDLKSLYIDRFIFVMILQIGLPASLQGIMFSLSNVIIQSSINSFGSTVLAGNSAAGNIEGFVYVAMNAFAQASISFVSQNVGAGKYNRINRITVVSCLCALVAGVVTGGLAVIFGEHLLLLYTSSPEVVQAGMNRLTIVAALYALCGVMDTMVGVLRGLGYSIVPMIVSLIGACGLRLFWIFTFFRLDAFHTPRSLYLTYPVSWILTGGTHIICFLIIRRKMKKKWGS